MAMQTIAMVVTKGGEIAAQVMSQQINGRTLYRWNGKWGAGCGALAEIAASIRSSMASRKGWSIQSGHDLLTEG